MTDNDSDFICNCGSELSGSHDHTTCGPPVRRDNVRPTSAAYPNSWFVCRKCDATGEWVPLHMSTGNKSYAMGFLNALDGFYPHPGYRLFTNKGELFEERAAHGKPKVNTN